MAVNSANHSIAAANAEATLRWAECGLQGGCGGANWDPSAFLADGGGLYSLNPATGSTVSKTSPNTTSAATWRAPAGTTLAYAGTALTGTTTPQYVIEELPPVVMPGDSSSQQQYNGGGSTIPYQVTAYATGADATSQTVLQSTFRP
jgi:Tfp pilus assembly protein PilX